MRNGFKEMEGIISSINNIRTSVTSLWGCCGPQLDAAFSLEDSLDSLKDASEQLHGRFLDLKAKVSEAQMDPRVQVLNEVKIWIGKVESLHTDVQLILQQGQQESEATCLGGRCPKNLLSSHKFHKVVNQKLSRVNGFMNSGKFDIITRRVAHHSSIRWSPNKTFGLEATYAELCTFFEMDEVNIIGVYGIGGVGKTTLLKKFSTEFPTTASYDVFIWVEGAGTKEGNVAKIQESIKSHLNIRDDIWNDGIEKAPILFRILKGKNFLLILDGVGVQIDLPELGIPLSNDGRAKIIFSTRDKDICHQMGAKRFLRVGILSPDKAFDLFKEKVGEELIYSALPIEDYAKKICNECKGLPLALVVVGATMSKVTLSAGWKKHFDSLKSYPSRFPKMAEQVYQVLEFSYDSLPDRTHKACFLYCSLFPENHDIEKRELISLWAAEGYFSECSDVYEAQKHGEDVILRLKEACLLEDGKTPSQVKMHDVIRDMAMWIACDHGSNMRLLVKEGTNTHPNKWEDIEKLSLWGKAWDTGPGIHNFSSGCPNLRTLFMRNIPEEDFQACELPITIKVLDTANNTSLDSLVSTIGRFVDLEYLNFSNSSTIKFPNELKNLKKLRHLLLNDISHLEFPRGVLCNLSSLHAISMLRSPRPWCDDSVLLDELESLTDLQVIRISIHIYSSFEKILTSPKLRKCICDLEASCVFDKSSLQTFRTSLGGMFHLETLMISDEPNPTGELEGSEAENYLNGIFQGFEHAIPLRKLTISKWKIFDLDWLKFAPKLEHLELCKCDLLEEVLTEEYWVADDLRRHVFNGLTTLILRDLPKLGSVCGIALKFPHLETVIVRGCPNLRKLPFNFDSTLKSFRCFMGEPDWVDQLEWEDEITKNLFFQIIEPFEPL